MKNLKVIYKSTHFYKLLWLFRKSTRKQKPKNALFRDECKIPMSQVLGSCFGGTCFI